MTWLDFLTHVLPSVEGCPESLAIDHTIKAAREFCDRTLVWNYACDPVLSQAAEGRYTLQLDDGVEMIRALSMSVDGLDYYVPNGAEGRRVIRRQGTRRNMAVFTGPIDFTIDPPPSQAGLKIVADIAVRPAMNCPQWPDDLDEHVTDIAHGAISSLCLLPRQEWSDTKTAGIHRGFFNERMGTVGYKVSRGYGHSRQRAQVVWC